MTMTVQGGHVVIKKNNAKVQIKQDTQAESLLRGWLVDSIQQYDTFTCKVELPDDRSELHAFQVLSHPRKMLGIQTFDTDPFQERRVWNLQPLEIVNAQDLSVDPMQLDVHDAHESREIDLVGMLSADIESRNDVRLWDTTQSDYSGCTALVNSRLATPLSPIISKSFPLVGLWDMLEVAGFMRVHRVVKHSVRSGKFYDEAWGTKQGIFTGGFIKQVAI